MPEIEFKLYVSGRNNGEGYVPGDVFERDYIFVVTDNMYAAVRFDLYTGIVERIEENGSIVKTGCQKAVRGRCVSWHAYDEKNGRPGCWLINGRPARTDSSSGDGISLACTYVKHGMQAVWDKMLVEYKRLRNEVNTRLGLIEPSLGAETKEGNAKA